jgi:hypothetical protein
METFQSGNFSPQGCQLRCTSSASSLTKTNSGFVIVNDHVSLEPWGSSVVQPVIKLESRSPVTTRERSSQAAQAFTPRTGSSSRASIRSSTGTGKAVLPSKATVHSPLMPLIGSAEVPPEG